MYKEIRIVEATTSSRYSAITIYDVIVLSITQLRTSQRNIYYCVKVTVNNTSLFWSLCSNIIQSYINSVFEQNTYPFLNNANCLSIMDDNLTVHGNRKWTMTRRMPPLIDRDDGQSFIIWCLIYTVIIYNNWRLRGLIRYKWKTQGRHWSQHFIDYFFETSSLWFQTYLISFPNFVTFPDIHRDKISVTFSFQKRKTALKFCLFVERYESREACC